jgi:DHA2 family multidrug resistance protein
MGMSDPTGVQILSAQVDQQAAMVGYSQVFHLMFLVTLVMMPIVLLMRTPKEGAPETAPHEAVME